MPIDRRRLLLLLPLAVAACGNETPPRTSFPPLAYDYLSPIGLNVAQVETEVRAVPNINVPTAVDPVAALVRMGHDRLKAYGNTGRAVMTVTEVSLVTRSGGYEGTFGVQLDIYTSANTRAGYAEARVYRRIDSDSSDMRGAVYDLEKQLMDAMNVELEYQIRRSLKAWIITTPPTVPTAVQQQPLPVPGSTAAPPASPAASPAASPVSAPGASPAQPYPGQPYPPQSGAPAMSPPPGSLGTMPATPQAPVPPVGPVVTPPGY